MSFLLLKSWDIEYPISNILIFENIVYITQYNIRNNIH